MLGFLLVKTLFINSQYNIMCRSEVILFEMDWPQPAAPSVPLLAPLPECAAQGLSWSSCRLEPRWRPPWRDLLALPTFCLSVGAPLLQDVRSQSGGQRIPGGFLA